MNLAKPIASGNTAEIYLHDDKIIKVFKDHLPETEALREANKQKAAHSWGLPVLKIVDVSKVNGKQAIIMEYVKGKTLGDLYFEDKNHAEKYLKISVKMQLKIHNIFPDSLEAMTDKLQRQIESVPGMSHKQKSCMIRSMESLQFENRLCHGDFHLYNLILSEDKVVIIDWVDSSAGDLRADVYRTYLLYSQFSKELAERYLTLYCEMSGVSQAEVFQWAAIIAGARLSENVESENEDRLWEIVNANCPV